MVNKQNIKKVISIIFWLAIFLLIAGVFFVFADNGYVPLNKARQIKTDVTNFGGTIPITDTDVQKALETIDAFSYLGLTAKAADSELWDGYNFADYLDQAVKTTSSPSFMKDGRMYWINVSVSQQEREVRYTLGELII